MTRSAIFILISFSLVWGASGSIADTIGKTDGKITFNKHCASCHPNGGNIINPAKSIRNKDLEKAGIKRWQDIVAKMRKPGPGMPIFNNQLIADKEARIVAEYILKNFK
jgi:cytochrome c6